MIRIIISIIFTFTLQTACIAQIKPVDQVYPLLDAAHSRWFYFSSACLPFGMVNLFPDNYISGEWDSGYRYEEDSIKNFSHIHEWQLSGVALLPVVFDNQNLTDVLRSKTSVFSHQTESVKVGYHSVHLDRYGINAELTASNRVGFHRYHFPVTGTSGVVFELSGELLGPSEMVNGGFKKVSDREIRGFMVNGPTHRRPKETPVYFSAAFSKPIKSILLYTGDNVSPVDEWRGEKGKIIVVFDSRQEQELLMKVGVSFTSEEGAAKNLSSEIPHWDFNRIVHETRDRWNEMLSRIIIEGGTPQQQRRFYTDLWHSIQGRRVISDADGKYTDLTGRQKVIRQLPVDRNGKPKFNMYNSDAFWGAQWTLNTLWQLVYPEIAEEFCNSFLEYYKNGGLIPRGPSGGNYTFVMPGASSTPFFVSAWQKGIRGFDINLAYEGLKKNHLPGGMMSKAGYEHNTTKGGGLESYMKKGYVPYPLTDGPYGFHEDGAGMTLEYAYQDWTLAQLAKSLKKEKDYRYFLKRSSNYKNLYNPSTGYLQPKDTTGKWKEPFDALQYDHGYVEANGAQSTWFVPHDLQGLFELMGGRDTAVKRLNEQFELSSWHRFCNENPVETPKFVDDKRTWLNYSNQPSMQTAFIFNHAGAPWLTQYWSREVINQVFNGLSPYTGYSGDEDQGLMGTLSVLMKIGLFQMKGGCEEDPGYEIGSPIFDAVTITLNPAYFKGKSFRILTINNSSVNRYIRKARLNGHDLNLPWIHHSDLIGGGELVLTMCDSPNRDWGINN
ncbi:MAG TPA: GH92 family glycosyl hydrolase [Cyclobacteriaceae bacterium]|nr:GH92 family glycosyl hydrolase [Cyclobacteriaceae bacterium]